MFRHNFVIFVISMEKLPLSSMLKEYSMPDCPFNADREKPSNIRECISFGLGQTAVNMPVSPKIQCRMIRKHVGCTHLAFLQGVIDNKKKMSSEERTSGLTAELQDPLQFDSFSVEATHYPTR